MKTLRQLYDELANEYGSKSGEMVFTFSDKGSMHSYIEFYEEFFKPYRKKVSILEIGLMTGGSLHLWQKYFSKYALVGIDLANSWNQPRSFQPDIENDPNIDLRFNTNSRTTPAPEIVGDRQFDFVIDDGDHSMMAQIETFDNFWKTVAIGGTYFVEDVVDLDKAAKIIYHVQQTLDADTFEIEHYKGFKNGRADDQIIAITRTK